MRIGLLTTSYPSIDEPGSGSFVEGFAHALADSGNEVEVLAPRPHGRALPRSTTVGVDVHFVPYAPRILERTFHGAGVPDNLRASLLAWPGLVGFPLALSCEARRRAKRWDALVSHFALPSGLIGALVRGGKPHLVVAHSADLHLLARLPARTWLAHQIEAGASALWFVSSEGKVRFERALGRTLGKPVHVGPMGVDEEAFTTTRTARPRDGALRILFLGRLVPIKGADILLDALEGVRGVSLVVVGDGPERARLEARALSLGLDVRFEGALYGEAKWARLREADLVVLPSRALADGRSEGAPLVALEAMAAGSALVASDTGGIPELVGDAALLFEHGDARALREAIVTMRDDATLRASFGARGHARAHAARWSEIGRHVSTILVGHTPSSASHGNAW